MTRDGFQGFLLITMFCGSLIGCGPKSPQQIAIAELENAGARFQFDEQSPSRDVIAVFLNGPQVTDSAMTQVKTFTELQKMSLIGTKVTATGKALGGGSSLTAFEPWKR